MIPLEDYIFESSIKNMSADEYREALKENFPNEYSSVTGWLKKEDVYQNPPEDEHTSDRKAFGGIPWIEYWKRMTGFKGNHLKCPFCNRDIFIDETGPDAFLMRMEHPQPSLDYYKAVGGHYHKNKYDNEDGYIIIPVCKGCNGKGEDEDFEVKDTIMFAKEIGAKTKE